MTPDRVLTLAAIFFVMLLALGVWTVWCLTQEDRPGVSDPGLRWPQRVAPPELDYDAQLGSTSARRELRSGAVVPK